MKNSTTRHLVSGFCITLIFLSIYLINIFEIKPAFHAYGRPTLLSSATAAITITITPMETLTTTPTVDPTPEPTPEPTPTQPPTPTPTPTTPPKPTQPPTPRPTTPPMPTVAPPTMEPTPTPTQASVIPPPVGTTPQPGTTPTPGKPTPTPTPKKNSTPAPTSEPTSQPTVTTIPNNETQQAKTQNSNAGLSSLMVPIGAVSVALLLIFGGLGFFLRSRRQENEVLPFNTRMAMAKQSLPSPQTGSLSDSWSPLAQAASTASTQPWVSDSTLADAPASIQAQAFHQATSSLRPVESVSKQSTTVNPNMIPFEYSPLLSTMPNPPSLSHNAPPISDMRPLALDFPQIMGNPSHPNHPPLPTQPFVGNTSHPHHPPLATHQQETQIPPEHRANGSPSHNSSPRMPVPPSSQHLTTSSPTHKLVSPLRQNSAPDLPTVSLQQTGSLRPQPGQSGTQISNDAELEAILRQAQGGIFTSLNKKEGSH